MRSARKITLQPLPENTMQARMKKYPLSEQDVQALLEKEQVGRVATTGADGYPYVTPVHFAVLNGRVYFHGLAVGEKLANIHRNPKVCFEIDRMNSLLHGGSSCDTNTEYQSVIIRGSAALVEDKVQKIAVLDAIVAKYTPQHMGTAFPDPALKMTAVVEITIESCTGKYYPAG